MAKLQQRRQSSDDLLLLNVLDEDVFEKAHIPGSTNVPVAKENFEDRVEDLVNGKKDEPIVVYCASTSCDASPKAARRLENAGFSRVFDYEGGTKAWKEAGLEVQGSEAQEKQ